MAGQRILDPLIGVRIPTPEPILALPLRYVPEERRAEVDEVLDVELLARAGVSPVTIEHRHGRVARPVAHLVIGPTERELHRNERGPEVVDADLRRGEKLRAFDSGFLEVGTEELRRQLNGR